MRILRFMAWLLAGLLGLAIVALGIGYLRSDNVCEIGGPAPKHPMRAAVRCEYGGPESVRIVAVERPTPGPHDILVRVRAVAVNPLDWHTVRGTPLLMRIDSGLRKPKQTRLGVDYAGTVEAVGGEVTKFKVGDEVFGGRQGAFAEVVVVPDDRAIALKPAGVSFEQAASVPIAATTALQAVRDNGGARAGTRVLINGASGGVGTYAVQIAKVLGADVTGVCSGRNVELVRGLGAARVIDYTKDDYTRADVRYDLIVDNVGNRTLQENRHVLAEDGRYVLIGGGGPGDHPWVGPLPAVLHASFASLFAKQQLGMMLADLNASDLATLAGWMQSGQVTPVIDRTYPFDQLPEALAYLEKGRARGKVVVTVP